MPVVVSCPKCEKKLAVKDELKGRALVCPQCKGRFSVPADDASTGNLLDIAKDQPATGGGMDFLNSLGPASAGATKGNGQISAPAYAATRSASGRPANGRPAVSSATAARTAGRAKKQAEKMKTIYIGGGIAAAVVLVVIVVAVVMNNMGGGETSEAPKKNENIRFNLTESQRKQFFLDMVHAVDLYGPTTKCRDEWRRLGGELKLTDSQISAVKEEGFEHGWDQPAMVATQDQKQKTNRRDWIRTRTETGHDPIM